MAVVASNPAHVETGRRGYFEKRASVLARPQCQKVERRADRTTRT
jgi:hypothetical protein